MIGIVLLLLLIPLLMGFILVTFFWPGGERLWSHLPVKIFSAVGIGLGIFSCFFFLWLNVFGPSSRGLIATLVVLVAGMAAALAYKRRKQSDAPVLELSTDQLPKLRFRWLLAALFFLLLAASLASFFFMALKRPHGEWDAWAIWNLRAKFIFKSGDQWMTAFSPLLKSHPDYPLLVPGAVSGLWTAIGTDTVLVPALIAMLFTFAGVGLTVSSLSILRGKSQAFLAGIILLGTPLLIFQGTWQYADVPLSFFFLATFVLLALQDRLPEGKHNFMVLAGVAAGLAAWTKNEGIVFVLAVAIARLILVAPAKGLRFYFRQMIPFAAGLAPMLAMIFYLKTWLAGSSGIGAQVGQNPLQKLMDPSRHLQVWETFVSKAPDFGGWVVSIPLLLVFYILLAGARVRDKEKPGIYCALIALGLMVIAYGLTYVMTPADINWHLTTSLDRLFLQLWPGFVFVYFMSARSVERVVAETPEPVAAASP